MAQRQKHIEKWILHKDVVWTCSDLNMLYFCSDELIVIEFELNGQEGINKCFEMALQSAAFSATVTNSTNSDLYVFGFLIDEEYRNIIKADYLLLHENVCINDSDTSKYLGQRVYGKQKGCKVKNKETEDTGRCRSI